MGHLPLLLLPAQSPVGLAGKKTPQEVRQLSGHSLHSPALLILQSLTEGQPLCCGFFGHHNEQM